MIWVNYIVVALGIFVLCYMRSWRVFTKKDWKELSLAFILIVIASLISASFHVYQEFYVVQDIECSKN